MRKIIIASFGLLSSLLSQSQEIIIKDINLITMTSNTVVKNQNVLLKDGKIAAIGRYKDFPKNKQQTVIDGKGKYLMPGLADMHVHLPESKEVNILLKMNVAAGVTHLRVMNSVAPQMDVKRQIESEPSAVSPKMHYSHLIKRDIKYSEQQFDSLLVALKSQNIDFIKLMSLSNEETFDNLMKSAKKQNRIVCGHYPKFAQFGKPVSVSMEKVLNNNFKSIEHLAGYDALENEEQLKNAVALTKTQNIYNCPTLDWDIIAADLLYPNEFKNRLTYKILPKSIIDKWETKYAEDVLKAGGPEKIITAKEKYSPIFEKKKQLLKMLYQNDCLLLLGSDSGNTFQADGFNVYEEMKNWSNLGIDAYTILKSATVHPAAFFNQQENWGTIEIGKNADVILLDKNPLENIDNITTVTTTILNGKIYQKADLMQ